MGRRTSTFHLAGFDMAEIGDVPLYRQLYDHLRDAILQHRLAGGTRLPSTRSLASELGIARATVVQAFDQLLAEGYLTSRAGSGTYVSTVLPDVALTPFTPPHDTHGESHAASLSQRGQQIATHLYEPGMTGQPPRAFRQGAPALDAFPFTLWASIASRYQRNPALTLPGYGAPGGYLPLREAIADYLRTARAVRCTPEQVIIVNGAQGGISLVGQMLLDPGDTVWLEDPGYRGARGALLAAGASVAGVPLDTQGIDLAAGKATGTVPRMIYVTPSHQFPLGVTMTLARRLELIELAQQLGSWILEDDYDSEYRYTGRPLASLQGLDTAGRVIYVGTFSKILFPALRLGYLVVPPQLIEPFTIARDLADRHSASIDQAIVATFIRDGHFARHIRQMRILYASRQAALLQATAGLADVLRVAPDSAGMHLIGWLAEQYDDRQVAHAAAIAGVEVTPLSRYALTNPQPPALLLGYAAVDAAGLREGAGRLEAVLRA